MRNIFTIVVVVVFLFSGTKLFSQNVSINTTGAANSTLSMLEVLQISTTANTKGLYISHTGSVGGGNTGYGLQSIKTGTTGTNVAGYFSATGVGAANYAIIVPSASGLVGFGTSAPTSLLHVADQTGNDVGPWVTFEGGANVYSNTGLRFWDRGTDLGNENVIEFGHNSTFVSTGRIKSLNPAVNATTGGRLYLETASNNTGTYNTNQLVLNNNGKVGVGTLAPDQNLSVYNGASVDQANLNAGTLTNGLSFGSASGEGIGSKRTATGNQYGLDFYTAFTNRMVIEAAGDVGINTTNPQGRLDVHTGASATDAVFIRTDPGANPWQGGIVHHQSTTYAFKQTVQNTSSATLGTMQFDYVNRATPTTHQKSNILVLQADGNIGAGTLAPSSLLHLQSANVVDVPRGDILLSRYWASNADTRASSIFHYYSSTTLNDNLAFAVSGGGGTNGQPNALAQIKMIVQGNGNVGIGTVGPGDRLEVSGGNVKITNGADFNGMVYSGDVNWGFKIQRTAATDDYNVRMSYYPGSGTRKAGIFNASNSTWPLYADATPNIIMNDIGMVAVGTASPNSGWGAKMEVYNGNLMVKNGATNFYTGLLGASGSSTGLVFRKDGLRHAGFKWDGVYLNLYNASGDCCNSDSWTGTGAMTWDISTGYVGVGKAAPGYPFTIGQTGNVFAVENTAGFVAKNAGGSYETYFWPRWNDNIMYMNYGSAGFQIRTNGSGNVMFMDNSSQVGVGRTTPDAQLHVNATFKVGDLGVGARQTMEVVAASGDVTIGSQTQDADVLIRNQAGTNIIHFGANSSSWFNGSAVGIGCTNPQYPLHVVGNMGVVGTIFASAASVSAGVSACSDIRYKKNISTLENSLEKVLALRGVNYFWKTNDFPEKNFSNNNQIGFIAQELEKIYPEFVVTDKDGYKSVDYSRLTPVLVEAMKEQQALILKLQSDVSKVKAENQEIRSDYDTRLKKLEELLGGKAEK